MADNNSGYYTSSPVDLHPQRVKFHSVRLSVGYVLDTKIEDRKRGRVRLKQECCELSQKEKAVNNFQYLFGQYFQRNIVPVNKSIFMSGEFRKYAVHHLGMSGPPLDDYAQPIHQRKAFGSPTWRPTLWKSARCAPLLLTYSAAQWPTVSFSFRNTGRWLYRERDYRTTSS